MIDSQVAQGRRVIHLTGRESLTGPCQRHGQRMVGHCLATHHGGQFHTRVQHVYRCAQGSHLMADVHGHRDAQVALLLDGILLGFVKPVFADFNGFF